MKNGGNLRQFGPLWGKGKLFVSQNVTLYLALSTHTQKKE
jgi:hypothetical protein